MNCQEILPKFNRLTVLKKEFEENLEKTRRDGKPRNLYELKKEIEELLIDIKSQEGMESLNNKLTGDIFEQMLKAREIMGEREVMGPEEVKKAFGIEVPESEVPPIPFNETELKRAKELGQFLVLRVDKTQDGQPLTMQKLMNNLKKILKIKTGVKYFVIQTGMLKSCFTSGVKILSK